MQSQLFLEDESGDGVWDQACQSGYEPFVESWQPLPKRVRKQVECRGELPWSRIHRPGLQHINGLG